MNCYQNSGIFENFIKIGNIAKLLFRKDVNYKWEFKEVTPRERNEHNEGDVDLLTNWISKISIKKLYFKREEQKEETKHQRTERKDIKGIVTKAKLKICYDRIIETVNERINIEAQQEIRVHYDCVIKLSFYYFNIFNNLYQIIFYWEVHGRRFRHVPLQVGYLRVYDGRSWF